MDGILLAASEFSEFITFEYDNNFLTFDTMLGIESEITYNITILGSLPNKNGEEACTGQNFEEIEC